MAYQTGTVANMSTLKSTIETFCTTNGWSLSGGVLYKGLSYVKLTATDAETLKIEGANSVDFLTTPCPYAQVMYIPSASFPITYHLFVHTTPDQFVCVAVYDSDSTQQIMFGDIVKIDNAAFTGGNWFWASRYDDATRKTYVPAMWYINDNSIGTTHYVSAFTSTKEFMPFCTNYFVSYLGTTAVHAEIDAYTWNIDIGNGNTYNIMLSDTAISSYYRGLNTSDSHSHLITMELISRMQSDLWGYIGYIEHIRLFRIDNYNIGDIIDLSPDKWMVFPWVKKESTYPVGRSASDKVDEQTALQASGGLGFAVRYDGP